MQEIMKKLKFISKSGNKSIVTLNFGFILVAQNQIRFNHEH